MEREGPSYTVDTLTELHQIAPDSELYLILGGDAAAGLRTWRQPERVLSLATRLLPGGVVTSRTAIDETLEQVPGGEPARFFRRPTDRDLLDGYP